MIYRTMTIKNLHYKTNKAKVKGESWNWRLEFLWGNFLDIVRTSNSIYFWWYIFDMITIFDDICSFFIPFHAWNNFKLNILQGMEIFKLFLLIYSEELQQFFLSLQQILIVKYFLFWYNFRVFGLILIARTNWKGRIYRKIPNCFYSKVSKLANLRNLNREDPEVIISSPYKRTAAEARKEN